MKQPVDFNMFFCVLGFVVLLIALLQIALLGRGRRRRRFVCIVPALFFLLGADMPKDRLEAIASFISPHSFTIISVAVLLVFSLMAMLRRRRDPQSHGSAPVEESP